MEPPPVSRGDADCQRRRPAPLATAPWLAVLGLVFMLPAVTGQEPPAVDFSRDVLPILRTRCFECHSGAAIRGDLRLDNEAGIARGGHSGAPIVAATPEESELILRVSSESDGYRMPRDGLPLTGAEIETLEAWIRHGARWTSTQRSQRASEGSGGWAERLGGLWNRLAERAQRPSWGYAGWTLLLLLPLVLAWRWLTAPKDDADGADDASAGFRIRGGMLWSTAALIVAVVFLYGRSVELVEENGRLSQQLSALDRRHQPELIVSREHLPFPPHPMHPSRLGGRYYRGNDERSESLFNGGFYRTATIDLALTDGTGQRKQRGDEIDPADTWIELTVERAPKATRELFSQRVLNSTRLKHFSETDPQWEDRILFNELEPEQTWQARIPVRDWANGLSEGKVYLFYGAQSWGEQTGRVHFGIPYRLKIVDGRIDGESELWMGSLYDLNGRVLVPGPDEVLLDRWFDFRPIPVIEGEAATDPELLGIPEHSR